MAESERLPPTSTPTQIRSPGVNSVCPAQACQVPAGSHAPTWAVHWFAVVAAVRNLGDGLVLLASGARGDPRGGVRFLRPQGEVLQFVVDGHGWPEDGDPTAASLWNALISDLDDIPGLAGVDEYNDKN